MEEYSAKDDGEPESSDTGQPRKRRVRSEDDDHNRRKRTNAPPPSDAFPAPPPRGESKCEKNPLRARLSGSPNCQICCTVKNIGLEICY